MNTQANPDTSTQIDSDVPFAGARRVLADAVDERAFPGCAFGVLTGEGVVIQEAIGKQTYDADAMPVKSATLYDIASVTKVVATTAASMLLYQRGVLDLETPLGEMLPGFVVGRPSAEHARNVTIRHLLAHNSGLPGYVELFRTETTPDSLLRAALQLPLEAEPGERAEYSDIGFLLLGKALEVLTRESLASWTHREIFEPLGLTSTRFRPDVHVRNLIPPTEDDTTLRNRRIQGEVQDENAWRMGGVAGHAGLFSNVADLLKFAGAILSAADAADSEAFFTSATLNTFAERQAPEGSSRALGWDTPSESSSAGRHFSPHSIGHLGFSGCSLWIDLDARVGVALLTNRTWPDRKNQQIREIRPAFHNAVREALFR